MPFSVHARNFPTFRDFPRYFGTSRKPDSPVRREEGVAELGTLYHLLKPLNGI